MGLDMYLAMDGEAPDTEIVKRVRDAGFLEQYKYSKEDMTLAWDTPQGERELPCVMYWRKVNAVHGWIVRTFADGVDECQMIRVPRKGIATLAANCREISKLANRGHDVSLAEAKAEELDMMPTLGFFFGNDELDRYYFEELTRTAVRLEQIRASKELEAFGFIYQASW